MAVCHNCAASLPESSSTCVYCGTVNDVDLRRVSDYTQEAPPVRRNCPDCHESMAVVDISAAKGTRFLVERCERCLGLFFDTNELEAVLDAAVAHSYQIDFARLGNLETPAPRDAITYRHCPDCGKLMNRVNFGARSGVITDQCRSHGVWLQPGELYRLLDWRKAGGLLYNEAVRKEKEKEAEAVEKERQERLQQILREAATYNG